MFADVVYAASDAVVTVFSLISIILSFSFNLSFFIGQLIVKFCLVLVSLLVDGVNTLRILFQVLTEDYFVFLSDITVFVSLLCKSVSNVGENVVHSFSDIISTLGGQVLSLYNFILSLAVGFVNFVDSIFYFFHYCLVLLKNSLVLVGLTSWDLVVFIPNSIASLKRSLVLCIVQFMAHIRDALNFVRLKGYKGMCDAITFVTDVPRESLYGLLACLGFSLVLAKYHRSLRPLLVRNVVFTLCQCQRTLIIVWNYLEAFTLWLLTNQMTPSLNGARYFAAEAGAGVPAVVNNVAVGNENSDEEHSENEAEHSTHMERKPSVEPEDRLCVVCQDRERCTIILPCRHVCLCYECCGLIKRTHGRCPICRHAVRRTMRVFIN